MKKRWIVALSLTSATALMVVLKACGDDEVVATRDAGVDASGPIAPAPDSTTPPDAGVDSSSGQTFTVPAGGGSVDVQGQSMKITLVFPASAAGKAITLALGTAADTGFPTGTFSDVIKLGPTGERFADPILVKPEKKALVDAVLTFTQGGAKAPSSPALYNATAGGYEVRHFTALVIVPPGKVCDSEGMNDTPLSARCAGDASTFRQVTCKGSSYCVISSGSCCIDPAVDSGTGCTVEQQLHAVTQQPSDSNGGQYPSCDGDARDWDGGDAGCTSSSVRRRRSRAARASSSVSRT